SNIPVLMQSLHRRNLLMKALHRYSLKSNTCLLHLFENCYTYLVLLIKNGKFKIVNGQLAKEFTRIC
ncbi:hypothetical protein, partial [Moorena sp. SIO4E2]|uniref:hypothetical protein n=1 Tax=Moorena sp. SIO4E2 TaxID=2607826 RepID=UPI0025810FAF